MHEPFGAFDHTNLMHQLSDKIQGIYRGARQVPEKGMGPYYNAVADLYDFLDGVRVGDLMSDIGKEMDKGREFLRGRYTFEPENETRRIK